MPLSDEIRRLSSTWGTGTGWPKRLNWLEISGIRGWSGQRFELRFPIMALVGENGAGKSTVLQCAASLYQSSKRQRRGKKDKNDRFASDFFLETPWDKVRNAEIRGEIREGSRSDFVSVKKLTERWRGNPERPVRNVVYVDLSRIQPVPARVGYTKLAAAASREVSAEAFEKGRLARFCAIMGRTYDLAKMAISDADEKRAVPVIAQHGAEYSGFHQGAGETTIAELLQADLPQYSLVLIDEVESSLHPRAQRRLIRDLASKCRELELQVVLTTHSPTVLDELPLDARAYILQTQSDRREIVYGVSPEFAMTKMDEVPQYEVDLYVEDARAGTMLTEIVAAHKPQLHQRCQTIPYGASSVGQALGQMAAGKKFPRASCVFLDGDQGSAPGCLNLPGEDPPERVVFSGLQQQNWSKLADRLGRPFADVADSCNKAMTLSDHHDWVRTAATDLVLPGETLWQAMCAEWARTVLSPEEGVAVTQPIEDALIAVEQTTLRRTTTPEPVAAVTTQVEAEPSSDSSDANGQQPLFSRLPDAAPESAHQP